MTDGVIPSKYVIPSAVSSLVALNFKIPTLIQDSGYQIMRTEDFEFHSLFSSISARLFLRVDSNDDAPLLEAADPL